MDKIARGQRRDLNLLEDSCMSSISINDINNENICPMCFEEEIGENTNGLCLGCYKVNKEEEDISENEDNKYSTLQIDNVDFWSPNELCKGGMRIYWSDNNIGFGTLDIIKQKGNDGESFEDSEEIILTGYTEYMDSQEDKSFTKKILDLLAEKLKIVD